MKESDITEILEAHKIGAISAESATEQIKNLSYENIGYARVDHARAVRQGFPEVIFGQGKTCGQIVGIFERLAAKSQNVLITRTNAEVFGEVRNIFTEAEWHESANLIRLWRDKEELGAGEISIVTAGTSDIPVAEEAALVAETMGNRVTRIWDAGIAVGRRRSGQSSRDRGPDFHRLRRVVRRHRRAARNAQFVRVERHGRQH